MKEPLSLRLSDRDDPTRGEKFETVLERKKATPTKVLQALVDAYVESNGDIDFPVQLVPKVSSHGDGGSVGRRHNGDEPRLREEPAGTKV